MIRKPKKVCNYPGCGRVTTEKYCSVHAVKGKMYDEKAKRFYWKDKKNTTKKKSSTARGYDAKWRRASKIFLARNPFCVYHAKVGIMKPAEIVDHIKPHKGDQQLFWDQANWQSLCKKCHDSVKQRIEKRQERR